MRQIELTENDKAILKYVVMQHWKIGEEIELRRRGSLITNRFGFAEGFTLKVNSALEITYNENHHSSKTGELKVRFKDVDLFDAEIHCTIDHWNGPLSHIMVRDHYYRGAAGINRDASRHDLEASVRYVIDTFEKEFYLPYLQKVKEQNLYVDEVFDEFAQLIKKS